MRTLGQTRFSILLLTIVSSCGYDDEPTALETNTQALLVRQELIERIQIHNKRQTADIVDVQPDGFVVGYVSSTSPYNVRYTYNNLTTGQQRSPFSLGGSGGRWLRANTSRFMSHFGCDRNYFAVERNGQTFWDSHVKCGPGTEWGTPTSMRVDLNGGMSPSMATKYTPGNINYDAFFVYRNNNGELTGRIYRYRYMGSSGFTNEFIMHTPAGGGVVSNTDIIYNQHSDRYIIGFTEESLQYCHVSNIVVADPGGAYPQVVRPQATFATCDADVGGHRTSVAYNPLGDGTYAWWRQDGAATHGPGGTGSKGVFAHYSDGFATGVTFRTDTSDPSAISSGTAATVHVAATLNASNPYTFFKHNTVGSKLYSFPTVTIKDDLSLSGVNQAVRSFQSGTAALIGTASNGTIANLRLLVSNQP